MNPLTNYEKGWNLRKEGGLPRKGGGETPLPTMNCLLKFLINTSLFQFFVNFIL